MLNDKFPFPENWDKDNKRTVTYFNKCSQFVDSQEELLSLFHIKLFYYIYCYIMIICFIISAILIIIYKDNYIIKRSSPELLIMFCIGCIICVSNSYGIQVHYTNYPCFLVLYFTGISYPMIFISCIACFTKYIKQYYVSANAYIEAVENNENIKKEKIKKRKFANIRKYLIEKHPVQLTILYNILITIYSFSISPLSENYRVIGNLDVGFCTLSIEYFPQLIIVLSFLFLYVPYILNVLRKIEDTFNIKNLIYITVISMFICVVGYLTSSLIPKYNCTPELIRLWPTDCFVILCCTVFHALHVVKPLFELFYVKLSIKKIDKSMKGLKKLLKDKTLFREYVEFCKNECCVENALFYKEYHSFKDAIYKYSNRKIQDNSISINTLIVDDQDITTVYNDNSATISFDNNTMYSNNDNSKNISSTNKDFVSSDFSLTSHSNLKCNKINLSLILNIAQNIIEKFILPNSEFEISIDNKISKKMITTFNKYEKMESDNNLYIEDFENSDLITIFDDAYEEVLTNLYLNTYLKYIKLELKEKN